MRVGEVLPGDGSEGNTLALKQVYTCEAVIVHYRLGAHEVDYGTVASLALLLFC